MQRLPIVCVDVGDLKSDAAALDALARLALRLRRCGYQLTLRHASQELLELIEFAGLSKTLIAEGRQAWLD
jgi:ABC-type transporter Mla MlaB component